MGGGNGLVRNCLYILLLLALFLSMSCGRNEATEQSVAIENSNVRPRRSIARDSLDRMADADIAIWKQNRESADSLMRVLGKHEGYNEFRFGMSRAEFDVAVHIWSARPCHNLVIGDVCYENLEAKFFHNRLYELEFSSDRNALYRYMNKAEIRRRDLDIDKKIDEMFPDKKYLAKEHSVVIGGSYTFYLRLYNPVVKQMLLEADVYMDHDIPQQDRELLDRIVKYKRDCILYNEAKIEEVAFLNEEKSIVKRMDKVVATRYK